MRENLRVLSQEHTGKRKTDCSRVVFRPAYMFSGRSSTHRFFKERGGGTTAWEGVGKGVSETNKHISYFQRLVCVVQSDWTKLALCRKCILAPRYY